MTGYLILISDVVREEDLHRFLSNLPNVEGDTHDKFKVVGTNNNGSLYVSISKDFSEDHPDLDILEIIEEAFSMHFKFVISVDHSSSDDSWELSEDFAKIIQKQFPSVIFDDEARFSDNDHSKYRMYRYLDEEYIILFSDSESLDDILGILNSEGKTKNLEGGELVIITEKGDLYFQKRRAIDCYKVHEINSYSKQLNRKIDSLFLIALGDSGATTQIAREIIESLADKLSSEVLLIRSPNEI